MPHNDLEAVTSAGGASSIARADKDRDLVFDPQSKSLEIEKSKAEKRFLRKLDMILLTYGCISQVIKYLDQVSAPSDRGRCVLNVEGQRAATRGGPRYISLFPSVLDMLAID
jgi:hypothetical protein